MKILVIGGTRNIGHYLVHSLVDAGHTVTVLNRGQTVDELPAEVERLYGNRTEPHVMEQLLGKRTFDVVVDNALYKGAEAETIVELFKRRIGHYIFLSTGQVYLVREDAERPTREEDYDGRLLPAPKINTFGFEEWQYGMDKRQAEDVLRSAYAKYQFPMTALRLPMVNSARDHFGRLWSYVLRLRDGGPILTAATPNYPLRHIYAEDVVKAIEILIQTGKGKGKAYNIAQDEITPLDDFLEIVGELVGVKPKIVRAKRALLDANGFLPGCSPFSERWMSELDNQLSKTELGLTYTPLKTYLNMILEAWAKNPPPVPSGYRRRRAELLLIEQIQENPSLAEL